MTITGTAVWVEIQKDATFMNQGYQYEEPAKILREYLENELLEIIGDMIGKQATIANLLETKVLCIKHALNSGLILRTIRAMPNEALKACGFSINDVLEMTMNSLTNSIPILEKIAKDVPDFLKQHGVSEEVIYTNIGVNQENIGKIETLTIGDILISQPGVILKMNE